MDLQVKAGITEAFLWAITQWGFSKFYMIPIFSKHSGASAMTYPVDPESE